MTINEKIHRILNHLTILMTESYCQILCKEPYCGIFSDNIAERFNSGEKICLNCPNDSINRYIDKYGYYQNISIFYPTVLAEINASECLIENGYKTKENWYEKVLNYGDKEFNLSVHNSGTRLKIIDPETFIENMYSYLDELLRNNIIIQISDEYYLTDSLEILILNKLEEIRKERNINFELDLNIEFNNFNSLPSQLIAS